MCALVHGHASAGIGPALCVVVMSAGGLFRSVVSSSSLKQAPLCELVCGFVLHGLRTGRLSGVKQARTA